MTANIIKTISILLCYMYTYTKITHAFLHVLSKKAFVFIFITLSSLSIILNNTNDNLTHFISLCIFWTIVSLYTEQPQKSFLATILSFTISVGMYAVASFATSLVLCLIFPEKASFPFVFLAILSSVLHCIGIYFLCKIKRLQKGMPFLVRHNVINTATVISLLLFIISFFISKNSSVTEIQKTGFFTIVFTLAFLIFWWQAQITKTYRHRLLMRELESRRTSEAEKDALIEKLYVENDRLARITHRDNSLITSLKDAAIKGLSTDFENPEEMLATREKLIANIEKLAEGRSSIAPDYSEKKARNFDTGLSLLDDLLHHMDSQALEQSIHFSVHFGALLNDFVPQHISESDLVHTVDDLLKNAFKATLTCESRAVQLQFYKLGKHLVIEVADNGIPFEVRSLVNMGIEKLTTYEDGSGIGLMDIWSTKEKYRATYHLDEYASTAPFSKKISLTFDKKNRYTIRTYRKNEILQMSRRADLQVYDDNE